RTPEPCLRKSNRPPTRMLDPPSVALLALLVLHRLSEAEAFAIHLEDVAAVRQPIQQGRCHPLALEYLPPFAERQIARHQQTPTLVTVGEHLEQQLGPGPAKRQVAQLVADQQVRAIQLVQHAVEL